jgi:broad specificity phosphatase PhoE
MTTLLLVRHGETDWNREGRWQGGSDTQLNDVGREQANALAATLDGTVDAVYSSDLARARETAEILAAKHGLQVNLDKRLRERGFGVWEGLTNDDIQQRDAETFERWRLGEGPGPEDAEPFDTFAARISSFLDELLERHAEEEVLVVSHGGSIRVIHALARELDYMSNRHLIPPVPNCVVARYAVRDGKLAPID